MCFCSPDQLEESDPKVGNLIIKVLDQLPTTLDAIIVASNPSLEIDPFESTLETRPLKEKHVIQQGTVKEGDVAVVRSQNRDLIYMNLPDKDKALVDFKTHNAIMKALEKAFEFSNHPKIGFAIPSFSVLNIDEKLYEQKMVNAIKLFSINAKKGIVYVQVKKSRVEPLLLQFRKKTYEAGECDQE